MINRIGLITLKLNGRSATETRLLKLRVSSRKQAAQEASICGGSISRASLALLLPQAEVPAPEAPSTTICCCQKHQEVPQFATARSARSAPQFNAAPSASEAPQFSTLPQKLRQCRSTTILLPQNATDLLLPQKLSAIAKRHNALRLKHCDTKRLQCCAKALVLNQMANKRLLTARSLKAVCCKSIQHSCWQLWNWFLSISSKGIIQKLSMEFLRYVLTTCRPWHWLSQLWFYRRIWNGLPCLYVGTLISNVAFTIIFQVTGFFVRRVVLQDKNIVMVAHLKSLDAYPSTIYHLLCFLDRTY